jgi:ABC-2 type transport system permease protein
MKAYLAVVRLRMSILFQSRAGAISNIGTQIFWGALNCAVVSAFYHQTTSPQPLSLSQAITLIWLSQAMLPLLPWVIDPELEHQVKNGNVAYELVRPIDLYWLWFFRSASYRIAPALCQTLPIFCIAFLFFDLEVPSSWTTCVTFFTSVIFAAALSAAIGTLIVISLFWTICGQGIQKLLPHTSLLLSGVALPLPLFPSWAQPFLSIQPLRGVIDVPSRIYTGVISQNEAVWYLGFQLLWCGILIALGRVLMRLAVRKFVILGG